MDFYLTACVRFLIKLDMASETLKLPELNLRYLLKRGTTYNEQETTYNEPEATWNDLQRPEKTYNEQQETTYNEQESTWNDPQRVRQNLQRPEPT